MPHIFNIPTSCSLVDILASQLLDKYKDNLFDLTNVTIFLPNRRAARELKNAFIRLHGLNATLLPKILPLGSIDEDGFSSYQQRKVNSHRNKNSNIAQ